ncbi:MAG: FkbM family methyltransferase [Bacteroidales bacterium]|nr:FkbM family methyltransferase [Bacteroidales bacterium]
MSKIKKITYNIIDYLFPQLLYKKKSFSQDGEDMLLASFYENQKNYKGFFIDVGAHHPFRFSNTAFFYNQGWKGINIEPTPNLFKRFKKHRKRDINLNYGIGNGDTLTFYIFNEGALNTFDQNLAKERDGSKNGKYKIINKVSIQTQTLENILDNYLPKNQIIDFLTIDVEGFDYQVLTSNNWGKYIPKYIMIECESSVENLNNDPIYIFLKSKNYEYVGRTKRTSIFRHKD